MQKCIRDVLLFQGLDKLTLAKCTSDDKEWISRFVCSKQVHKHSLHFVYQRIL